MAGKINLQKSLQKTYERRLFISEVLNPVFQNRLAVLASPINEPLGLTENEEKLIKTVLRYGSITLDDKTNIACYEITLHNTVRLEQNKISIQQYVRKLIISGEAALINFISDSIIWRFSLVASDTKIMDTGEIKDIKTNAKRYTYLLGKTETCLTAATQLAILEGKPYIERKDLVDAFSVEKVSKPFFDEYTKIHYKRFNDFLINSNFKISVFNSDEKAIRDFVKKLLGRIVFLYFVQKKGWLGNNPDFMMSLFKTSGGNDSFYPLWLSKLFFDTLNAPRQDDTFEMPDKAVVKIPFLNGGLFEKDKYDESILTFPPVMFHNPENPETDKERGFLDFLNAYNFTVYEDSPDDHTVAVDPEMLGHIFENLLEDNKDKGAFYTPKEIVHYMCQESLIEYLCTPETSSPNGKVEMGKTQTDMFGNDSRKGQLFLETPVEETPIIRENDADFKKLVESLIKNQEVSTGLSKQHLTYLSNRLDAVRICDPAIGSGAFPMGLLHEIFNAKVLIVNTLNGVSPMPDERVEIKLHIIQNSIYGVDIEKGAVDIARLRFWLSLIVDEQTPKALPNLDYKIVVGNSLVSKFEDEVIAIDWEIKEEGIQSNIFGSANNVEKRQDLLKEISEKQHDFFIPENDDKKAIALKIKNLKVDLLMNQLELMIKDKHQTDEPKVASYKTKALFMKAQESYFQTLGWQQNIQKLKRIQENPTATLHFFDWKLDFPEVLNPSLVGNNGGFDIVIGNPPYLRIQGIRETNSTFADVLTSTYKSASGSFDLYVVFVEKALSLINSSGIVNYIMPTKWTNAAFGKGLRQVLLEKSAANKIISFGAYQVFDASTYTGIQYFKTNSNELVYFELDRDLKSNDELSYYLRSLILTNGTHIPKNKLTSDIWTLAGSDTSKIIDKLNLQPRRISDVFEKIFQGLATSKDDVYFLYNCVSEDNYIIGLSKQLEKLIKIEKDFVKPLLKGEDVHKYDNITTNRVVIFPYKLENGNAQLYKEDEIKKRFPLAYSYLKECEIALRDREKGRLKNDIFWYKYIYPKNLTLFSNEKLMAPEISLGGNFSYDKNGDFYSTTKVYGYIKKDTVQESYIFWLGLFNSKLFWYFIKQTGYVLRGGYYTFKTNYILPFPIPKIIESEIVSSVENLVKKILEKKKKSSLNNILDEEKEIDKLIYKLYDLTPNDIKEIEM